MSSTVALALTAWLIAAATLTALAARVLNRLSRMPNPDQDGVGDD